MVVELIYDCDLFKIVDIFWNDLIVDCDAIYANVSLCSNYPYAIVFLNCHMHRDRDIESSIKVPFVVRTLTINAKAQTNSIRWYNRNSEAKILPNTFEGHRIYESF